MAYSVVSKKSGQTYYLHAIEFAHYNGKRVTYYFAPKPGKNALDAIHG